MSKFYGEGYAEVKWRAEDVQSINGAWSLEKCEEWLQDNEHRIEERLTELGWEIIDLLLRETSDE